MSTQQTLRSQWSRWAALMLVLLIAVGAPRVVSIWSGPDPSMSTGELLQRIHAADDLAFSGYVQAESGLALPMTAPFAEIVDLSSGTSRMHVWWRDAMHWRVDRLEPPGGDDLYHDGEVTIRWNSESLQATRTVDGLALLPGTLELLPPQLARWALEGVATEDVARLPATRVAGIEAAGLRVTPSGPGASIHRVDVWADPDTGLPLRVQIWGNDPAPAVDTHFLDVEFARPPVEMTAFQAPAGSLVAPGGSELIGHIPGVYRSVELAGLPLVEGHATEPVNRYGQGLTQVLVLALDKHVAEPLRRRLAADPRAVVDSRGTWLSAGPLHLLLSPCVGQTASWLLAGTVDNDILRRAAREVYAKEWESPTGFSC